MNRVAVVLSINVIYEGPQGQRGAMIPLITLTGLVSKFYQVRAEVRRVTKTLATATTMARIGVSAWRYGLMGV
jgi:hypothetical protein